MLIEFCLKLRCLHNGKNFFIVTKNSRHVVSENRDIELKILYEYRGQSDFDLFSIVGMTAGLGQRVTVIAADRNGAPWKNYFFFSRFNMRDNLYVENKRVDRCWELCFNGDFGIFVDADRGQFEFSSHYRSKQRQDFVFYNIHLDANEKHDHYWCNTVSCRDETWHYNHTDTWDNQPFMPEYQQSQRYQYGCFGCSFTRGTGLRRGEEWPALLKRDYGSVINLGEVALGADGIFLNLKSALKKFQLEGIIILWPNLHSRFCWRWRVDEWHLRMPVSLLSENKNPGFQSIWRDDQKYRDMMSVFRRRVVQGNIGRRSRRIIARTVRLLKELGLPAWHSSWDSETYNYLECLSLGNGLLPPFPERDCGAFDGRHPSAQQQESWYGSIRDRVAP